jgi:hypothetical protein
MALINDSETRDVYGLTPEEKQSIIDFLQGAVYCWCKNRPDEWFSMRDLMGGENFYWDGTPLQALFQKHIDKGKTADDAIKAAGIDSGWLLKTVIRNDNRDFELIHQELINKYLWVRN